MFAISLILVVTELPLLPTIISIKDLKSEISVIIFIDFQQIIYISVILLPTLLSKRFLHFNILSQIPIFYNIFLNFLTDILYLVLVLIFLLCFVFSDGIILILR